MNERRLCARTAHGLEQIERPPGIYVEVVERASGSEVVTGLCRGMDHRLGPEPLHQLQDADSITDVEFVMGKPRILAAQALLIPARVTLGAEEVGAHVVVEAMDRPPEVVEMRNHLGADQPIRAGNEQLLRRQLIRLSGGSQVRREGLTPGTRTSIRRRSPRSRGPGSRKWAG